MTWTAKMRPGAAQWALCVMLACALTACAGKDARHHAMASAVIQRAGGDALADVSDAQSARILHRPSGLVCELPEDGAFDLEVFPPDAVNAGVSCVSASGGVALTYIAVHYGASITLDQAYAEALAQAIGPASPRRWSGQPSAADLSSPEGLPHFRIARLEGDLDRAPHYLRLSISEARGWFVQQIVSAPLDQAGAAETTAGEGWRRTLRAFAAPTNQSRSGVE